MMRMLSSVLLSEPEIEPVTLDGFKSFARISGDYDDAFLITLLCAGRQWAEAYTRRCFITQRWISYASSCLRDKHLILPKGPVQKVEEILQYDEDDKAQVWEQNNYYVSEEYSRGIVVLRNGAVWPDELRSVNGISVSYIAGYGDAASDVPMPIRTAIMQLALYWYENRGDVVGAGEVMHPPFLIEGLLAPYRILELGGA